MVGDGQIVADLMPLDGCCCICADEANLLDRKTADVCCGS